MSDANKKIVEDAYAAMASGDVKGFLAALDPEIELREPDCLPYGGVYRGVDELLGFFGKAAQTVAPGISVDHVVADGDRVVAQLRLPLKNGSEAVVSEHWLLRDGKAVELRAFWFDPTIAA